MQRLIFEAVWDRTIDARDRERIKHVFEQVNEMDKPLCPFLLLNQVHNHRGDLLITVLIQNGLETNWILHHQTLTYYEANTPIATETFSDKRLVIPGKCSMPWTFIFPKKTIQQEPYFKEGQLRSTALDEIQF
ncbi:MULTISPECIES: SLAP domain-containing protein [Clostridia]|uniref:SLAP domain-containing protein n=1 Tax=Clostridia TaxID=186801 RepID=UPI000EA2C038|nr:MULTISPECIES: SLAP domain-containing protein [Clostridia]NBJ69482.1 SLAP domain-containing protein [Roseburia sp. 1XD42-34]RKI78557.1 SLAP domain-containing protein [Clostridium sp. 1xD42-85]